MELIASTVSSESSDNFTSASDLAVIIDRTDNSTVPITVD